MTKQEIVQELNKYSKEDIVNCLNEYGFYFNSYPLNTLISRLDYTKKTNSLEKQQKNLTK